jgi:para-nitrobenzyl esterase
LLPTVSFPTGAYHAAELQYLFDLPLSPILSPGLTPDQRQLSQAMVRYWTRFARDGSPNGSHEPVWHRVDDDRMRFQALTAPVPASATGFAAEHQCAFWSAPPA